LRAKDGDGALSKHPAESTTSSWGIGVAAVKLGAAESGAAEFSGPGSAGAVWLPVGAGVAFTIASLHALAMGADASGVAFAMAALAGVTMGGEVRGVAFAMAALDGVATGCGAGAVGAGMEDDFESLFALAEDAAAGAGPSAMGMASGREKSVSAAVCVFVALCGLATAGRAGFGDAASAVLGKVSAGERPGGAIAWGATGSGAGTITGLGRNGKNEEKLEAGDGAGSLRAPPLAFIAAGGPALSLG